MLATTVGAAMAFAGAVMLAGGDPLAGVDLAKGLVVAGLGTLVLVRERQGSVTVTA